MKLTPEEKKSVEDKLAMLKASNNGENDEMIEVFTRMLELLG